jgi:hypothetical protein
MSQKTVFTKFKSLEDLVRFIAFSPTPFLHHLDMEGRQIYFIQILGLGGAPVIHYVEKKDEVKGKYIVYNRFRDTISFSDKLGSGGQETYIPILEIEYTNVFSEFPLKK